jgi:hypothetical protein
MLNGFNIQQLMNSITLLDTVIHDPVGLYFGGIVTGNADSLNNVLPMKYIPWPQANVPQTLDCEVRHHARTETTGKNVHYFRAGFEALDLATECVLNWADNPVRVRRAKPPKPSQSTGASRPDPFSDVAQIELVMEPGLFAPVAHYARRIANAQPKTLSDLKVALENDLISDEFFVLNDNSKVAVTVQKLGCVQALRRLFGELTRRL